MGRKKAVVPGKKRRGRPRKIDKLAAEVEHVGVLPFDLSLVKQEVGDEHQRVPEESALCDEVPIIDKLESLLDNSEETMSKKRTPQKRRPRSSDTIAPTRHSERIRKRCSDVVPPPPPPPKRVRMPRRRSGMLAPPPVQLELLGSVKQEVGEDQPSGTPMLAFVKQERFSPPHMTLEDVDRPNQERITFPLPRQPTIRLNQRVAPGTTVNVQRRGFGRGTVFGEVVGSEVALPSSGNSEGSSLTPLNTALREKYYVVDPNKDNAVFNKPFGLMVKQCLYDYHNLATNTLPGLRRKVSLQNVHTYELTSALEEATKLQTSLLDQNEKYRAVSADSTIVSERERHRAQEAWREVERTKVYNRTSEEGAIQRHFLEKKYTDAIEQIRASCEKRLKELEVDRSKLAKENETLARRRDLDSRRIKRCNGRIYELKRTVNVLVNVIRKVKSRGVDALKRVLGEEVIDECQGFDGIDGDVDELFDVLFGSDSVERSDPLDLEFEGIAIGQNVEVRDVDDDDEFVDVDGGDMNGGTGILDKEPCVPDAEKHDDKDFSDVALPAHQQMPSCDGVLELGVKFDTDNVVVNVSVQPEPVRDDLPIPESEQTGLLVSVKSEPLSDVSSVSDVGARVQESCEVVNAWGSDSNERMSPPVMLLSPMSPPSRKRNSGGFSGTRFSGERGRGRCSGDRRTSRFNDSARKPRFGGRAMEEKQEERRSSRRDLSERLKRSVEIMPVLSGKVCEKRRLEEHIATQAEKRRSEKNLSSSSSSSNSEQERDRMGKRRKKTRVVFSMNELFGDPSDEEHVKVDTVAEKCAVVEEKTQRVVDSVSTSELAKDLDISESDDDSCSSSSVVESDRGIESPDEDDAQNTRTNVPVDKGLFDSVSTTLTLPLEILYSSNGALQKLYNEMTRTSAVQMIYITILQTTPHHLNTPMSSDQRVTRCPLIPRFLSMLACMKFLANSPTYKNLWIEFLEYVSVEILPDDTAREIENEWLLEHFGRFVGALCLENEGADEGLRILYKFCLYKGPFAYAFSYGLMCSDSNVLGWSPSIMQFTDLSVLARGVVFALCRSPRFGDAKKCGTVIDFLKKSLLIPVPDITFDEFFASVVNEVKCGVESGRMVDRFGDVIGMLCCQLGVDWFFDKFLATFENHVAEWRDGVLTDAGLLAIVKGMGLAAVTMRRIDLPDTLERVTKLLDVIFRIQNMSDSICVVANDYLGQIATLKLRPADEPPEQWDYERKHGGYVNSSSSKKKKKLVKKGRPRSQQLRPALLPTPPAAAAAANSTSQQSAWGRVVPGGGEWRRGGNPDDWRKGLAGSSRGRGGRGRGRGRGSRGGRRGKNMRGAF